MLGIIDRDDELPAPRDAVKNVGDFTDKVSQYAVFILAIPLPSSPPARHDIQCAQGTGGPDQLFHHIERNGDLVREPRRGKTDRTRLDRLLLQAAQ
nr:hypothetical protein [Streptomyces hygroscopicus]